jgi:hypothetical protein
MTSAIDASKPVAGNPTTQSVRDNFATAKSEITALQAVTVGAPYLPLGGTLTANFACNDITVGGNGGFAGNLTLSGNLGANHGTFGGNVGIGLVLTVSGNANVAGTVTCNNLVQTSDDRIKEDVEPLGAAAMLDGIKALRPVSYFLRDSETRSFGLLASEIAETPLRGAVYHNETDGLGYVSYSHLLAAAIGAIQELEARIAALGG